MIYSIYGKRLRCILFTCLFAIAFTVPTQALAKPTNADLTVASSDEDLPAETSVADEDWYLEVTGDNKTPYTDDPIMVTAKSESGNHSVVAWESSNPKVVQLDSNNYEWNDYYNLTTTTGRVGKSVITATDSNGQKRSCVIQVNASDGRLSGGSISAQESIFTKKCELSLNKLICRPLAVPNLSYEPKQVVYEVYCSKGKGSFKRIKKFKRFDDSQTGYGSSSVDKLDFTLKKLTPNTRYRFKVRISLDGGETWAFRGKPVTYYTAARPFQKAKNTETKCTWKKVKGASGYLVATNLGYFAGYNIFGREVYKSERSYRIVKRNSFKPKWVNDQVYKGKDYEKVELVLPIIKHGKYYYCYGAGPVKKIAGVKKYTAWYPLNTLPVLKRID